MRIIDTIPVLEEDTRRRVLVPPARVILARHCQFPRTHPGGGGTAPGARGCV